MERFRSVLCVVEPSSGADEVLQRAAALAANHQARLVIATVIDEPPGDLGLPQDSPLARELVDTVVNTRRERMGRLLERHRDALGDVELRVLQGLPFLQVIREVLRNGHDLVIKAAQDPEFLDRLFGNDDIDVLRKCPCPVWLVKPGGPVRHQRILAAVDPGEQHPEDERDTRHALDLEVLELASMVAVAEFGELHVGHAWEAVGESALRGGFMRVPDVDVATYVDEVRSSHERAMARLLDEAAAAAGEEATAYLEPTVHMVKGHARKAIPALARDVGADLLVMGTVARTGLPGLVVGNTAETILHGINCSVLAIKPPGFQTPVSLDD